jgi:hypothetical protein
VGTFDTHRPVIHAAATPAYQRVRKGHMHSRSPIFDCKSEHLALRQFLAESVFAGQAHGREW